MKTTKMSLANIKGKLSRDEMKKIMAGSGGGDTCTAHYGACCTSSQCCEGYTCEGTSETKFCLV